VYTLDERQPLSIDPDIVWIVWTVQIQVRLHAPLLGSIQDPPITCTPTVWNGMESDNDLVTSDKVMERVLDQLWSRSSILRVVSVVRPRIFTSRMVLLPTCKSR
jgi:hypothetical protein